MDPPNELRVVDFLNPDDFVKATKSYDDSYMNFAIGALLDNMDTRLADSQTRWGGGTRTLLALYRGFQLLVTITKIAKDFSWIISTVRNAKQPLEEHEIPPAVQLLASHLCTIIDPPSFDKLLGPEIYVNAFLEAWIYHMAPRGLSLRLLDPYFRSKVSYATLATIPEPSSAFAHYKISQAEGEADIEALAHLYVEFSSHGPNAATVEEGRATMNNVVKLRRVWVCKAEEGTIVGYVMVGRLTPRTIAIKNVFVSPYHRRKGVAEAVVRAVTRYYLGAIPLGFEGGPGESPGEDLKEEICLNVADKGVERLYKRTGFLFGANDPSTGEIGWYKSSWRGVEPVSNT